MDDLNATGPDAAENVQPGTRRPTRTIGQNLLALVSSQVATWVISAVVLAIMPRLLGPSAYGSLNVAKTYAGFAFSIALFGTPVLLTIEVARHTDSAADLMRKVIKLRFALYLVLAPAVIVILRLGNHGNLTIGLAVVSLTASALALVADVYGSGLYGLQEMGYTAKMDVLVQFGAALATISLLFAGAGAYSVVGVDIVSTAVAAVVLARIFRLVVAGRPHSPSSLAGRSLIAASLPYFGAHIALFLYQRVDVVIVSSLVDRAAVGYYTAADALFGSLIFLPVVATTAMFPAMAEMHERAPADAERLVLRAFSTMLLVSVPVGLGTVLIAPEFVTLLYGSEYEKSGPILAVYGIVVLLTSQTIVIGRYAAATDRVGFWTALVFACALLTVPLDIVLVPYMEDRFGNGAVGGATAYLVTESIMVVVGYWKIVPALRSRTITVRTLKCGAAGALMVAAGWPLRGSSFLLTGSVATAVYGVAIVVLRTLDERDRQMISNVVRRLTPRRSTAA